jgi:hypothetical protein
VVALANNRLLLKDGKAASSPTAYMGAARIRAVGASPLFPGSAVPDGEAIINLQISLEPKLLWRRLTALRIDKVVDDQDQTLVEAAASETAPPPAPPAPPGGGIGFMLASEHNLGYGPSLYTSLRLKKGEKPAKTIKELKGTLTAEVFGPIKPMITVDNLLKAAGKTFKGDDGASLEVLEVTKGDDDQITVKLALDPPADWGPSIAAAGVAAVPLALPGGAIPPPLPAAKLPPPPAAPAGGGAIIMRVPANTQGSEISLVDGQGKAVKMTNHTLSYRAGDKGYAHMHEFTFRLAKDQDKIKLIFSGRRPATIEVPFTLKDVPLAERP